MSGQPIKIGDRLSLTGGLASNGRTARLAHQIWEQNVNRKGGLLGRPVQIYTALTMKPIPSWCLEIYSRLLNEEKVDLVIGGYGDNSVYQQCH